MKLLNKSLVAVACLTLLSACNSVGEGFNKTAKKVDEIGVSLVGQVVNYQCDNTASLTVRYYNKGESDLADVTLTDAKNYTLVNVISGSGAKYVGGIYELWSKGSDLTVTNLMSQKSYSCKEVSK